MHLSKGDSKNRNLHQLLRGEDGCKRWPHSQGPRKNNHFNMLLLLWNPGKKPPKTTHQKKNIEVSSKQQQLHQKLSWTASMFQLPNSSSSKPFRSKPLTSSCGPVQGTPRAASTLLCIAQLQQGIDDGNFARRIRPGLQLLLQHGRFQQGAMSGAAKFFANIGRVTLLVVELICLPCWKWNK